MCVCFFSEHSAGDASWIGIWAWPASAHTPTPRPQGLHKRPVSQISPKDNRLPKKKAEAQGGLGWEGLPEKQWGTSSWESQEQASSSPGPGSRELGPSCSCPVPYSPHHPPETGSPACSLPIVPAPQYCFPCTSCLHRKPAPHSWIPPPSLDGWLEPCTPHRLLQ